MTYLVLQNDDVRGVVSINSHERVSIYTRWYQENNSCRYCQALLLHVNRRLTRLYPWM